MEHRPIRNKDCALRQLAERNYKYAKRGYVWAWIAFVVTVGVNVYVSNYYVAGILFCLYCYILPSMKKNKYNALIRWYEVQ